MFFVEPLPVRPNYGPCQQVPLNVTEILKEESAEQRLQDMSTAVKSNTDPMCNGSTRQMKSVSDMMKFPDSTNNAAETTRRSHDNKTSAQMQSQEYLPALTEMLGKSTSDQTSNTEHTDLESSTLNSTPSNTNNAKDLSYPEIYQTSFPNINVTTGIESAVIEDTNLIRFDYDSLDSITGNFSESLIDDPNNGLKGRIGSGGFGDVYVGKDSVYGWLAVKKAHSHLAIHRKPDIAMRIFNAEVKYLSQFRHNNIVPILGFSMNGPALCIVCEYIEGGSLQQNIEARVIDDELTRINIMTGTAEGLKYLHTSDKPLQSKRDSSILDALGETDSQNSTKHFVHGDVKTANILLTKDFIPKVK